MTKRYYTLLEGLEPGRVVEWSHGEAKTLSKREIRHLAGEDVVAFVSGLDVLHTRLALPAKRGADLKRAATFAIEDDLAVSAEATHVAISDGSGADALRDIYAVAPSRMTEWNDWLIRAGWQGAMLVPETAVLPMAQGVFDIGDRLLCRRDGEAFAVDEMLPDDAKTAILAGMPSAQTADDVLATLAGWAQDEARLTDLSRGLYGTRRQFDFDLSFWKIPAAMAAATALTWLGVSAMETYAMTKLSAGHDDMARSIYASSHPGAPIPRNLAARVIQDRQAQPTRPKMSFLDSSAALYAALEAVEGVSVRSLRFDAESGQLKASLSYPDFERDLSVKTALETAGYAVNLGDTQQDDGRVMGELTLEVAS
jgi:type II secretion system protein L